MATYSAQVVAAEIRRRLPGVATKKLHKLLYYAQAHHAANLDVPLFSETIAAWDMGPVVAQLWWAEKNQVSEPTAGGSDLGEAELNTIGYVVSRYGRLSGGELERLTHTERPWIEADGQRRRLGQQSYRMPVSVIAQYVRDEDSEDEPAWAIDASRIVQGAADRELHSVPEEDSPEKLRARLR